MATELTTTSVDTDVVPVQPDRADRNPTLVYLASLSEGSRRTMRKALDTIAGVLTSGRADAATLPWWEFRFQHTAAVRSRLAEMYAPATANRVTFAVLRFRSLLPPRL